MTTNPTVISTCSICQSDVRFEIDIPTTIIKTQCNHFFHLQCWSSWWLKSNHLGTGCPNCRIRINAFGSLLKDAEYITLLEEKLKEYDFDNDDEIEISPQQQMQDILASVGNLINQQSHQT